MASFRNGTTLRQSGQKLRISGRELIAAGAEMSEVTFRMWVRYRSDVTSASRIIWKQKGHDAKAFDIQSAIPDEKATVLELLCKGGLKP